MTLPRRLVAELLGTALLLAAVVGSGIMGERLCGGNVAIALLANTRATGATLVTLIFTFGAVSGAHFNPAVTLADACQGGMRWRDVPGYIAAQAAREQAPQLWWTRPGQQRVIRRAQSPALLWLWWRLIPGSCSVAMFLFAISNWRWKPRNCAVIISAAVTPLQTSSKGLPAPFARFIS